MLRVPGLPAAVFLCFSGCFAAGPDLVSVCDVMRAPETYDHREIVLLGRVSKRESGRFVSQDACEAPGSGKPIAIRFDRANGPLPPDGFGLDKSAVGRKFVEISQHTGLQEFKLGTGFYDRWGMVFGRFEREQGAIVCRGDALVFYWEP